LRLLATSQKLTPTQSVSGTQQSCASVGDKLTITGKVSREMTGQGPVDERRYLEHHALLDRQPVQLTKHW